MPSEPLGSEDRPVEIVVKIFFMHDSRLDGTFLGSSSDDDVHKTMSLRILTPS